LKAKNDLYAYLKALAEGPVNTIFLILDILGVMGVFWFVIDDLTELIALVVFLLVVLGGNYRIFMKQRADNAKLANRIAELEDHQPKLALLFLRDGETSQHLTITLPKLPQQPDLDELVRHEAQELDAAFLGASGVGEQSSVKSILNAMQYRKNTEQQKEERDRYLERYRKYWQDLYRYERTLARRRNLRFTVTNMGRASAEDVVVFIHFPDQLHLLSGEELVELDWFMEERPKPPARPKPTVSLLDALPSVSPNLSLSPRALFVNRPGSEPSDVRGPLISPEDTTEVSYEIAKLVHGLGIDLDPVEFLVSEDAIGHVLELEFSIHASNLSERITGTLLLEIQLDEGGQSECDQEVQ